MRVGFVGLGLMGLPMARNLIAAGHELLVYSASAAPVDELVGLGAEPGESVADIAAQVDVFLSCRVTPEQSEEVFIGKQGVVAAGRRGLLAVDLATVTPMLSRKLAARLAESGIGFIDAPISGGPDGAATRTLSIIAGGSDADIQRGRQVLLDAGGKTVFHMGPPGAGVATKLCNNLISITTHVLVAEAMVLGTKSGLDPRRLYEVLRASSARSNTLERVVPNYILPRNFLAAATIQTVIKDVVCAIDNGRELGVALSLGQAALEALQTAARNGFSEQDIAAVILPMEAAAGVVVGPA